MSSTTFGRKQIVVRSADRDPTGQGTACDFSYTLPSLIRDVVHVNLFQCIVENGIFNIDDTNNNFVLSQLATDSGGFIPKIDFPFQGNGCSLTGDANWITVGRGSNPILKASVGLLVPIWSAPTVLGIPALWDNSSELLCVNALNSNVVIGGNNLIAKGFNSNILYSNDNASTFSIASSGGPSVSVNAVSIGKTYTYAVGNDGNSTTKTSVVIDNTNNQLILNVKENKFPKLSSNGEISFQIIQPNDLPIRIPVNITDISPATYTIDEYCTALNIKMAIAFSGKGFIVEARSINSKQFNLYIVPTSTTTVSGRYVYMSGDFPQTDWGIPMMYPSNGTAQPYGFQFMYASCETLTLGTDVLMEITTLQGSSYIPTGAVPTLPTKILSTITQSLFIPANTYSGSDFASIIATTCNNCMAGTDFADITLTVSLNGDYLQFNSDATADIVVQLQQYQTSPTPEIIPATKLALLMGCPDQTNPIFRSFQSPSVIPYNAITQYPLWQSADGGITWTAITTISNKVITAVSQNTVSGGEFIWIGGNGFLQRSSDAGQTWNYWSSYEESGSQSLQTITAIQCNPTDGDLVAIGNNVGDCLYHESGDPYILKIGTMSASQTGQSPQVFSIAFFATDGAKPTWVWAGTGISYVISTGGIIGETLVEIDLNTPYVNTNFPQLAPIRGVVLALDSSTVNTLVVGSNIGSYLCSDISHSDLLDVWQPTQDFITNTLIQLDTGYYTNTTLAQAIQTILNEVSVLGSGMFYVEVMANGKLDISHTTSSDWGIRFTYGDYIFTGTAQTLGFTDVGAYYTPLTYDGDVGPYYVESDAVGGIDLQSYEYVLIKSDKFGNDLISKSVPAWWFVPNTANGVNSNSIVYENVRPPTLQFINNPRDIQQFDIKITDQNGDVIQIQDNKNSTLVIEFYTKPANCR